MPPTIHFCDVAAKTDDLVKRLEEYKPDAIIVTNPDDVFNFENYLSKKLSGIGMPVRLDGPWLIDYFYIRKKIKEVKGMKAKQEVIEAKKGC